MDVEEALAIAIRMGETGENTGLLNTRTVAVALATEVRRLQAQVEWQPIETAPRDGTIILVANECGAWAAKYRDRYQSGYRPENPWASWMLNLNHIPKITSLFPTHWRPIGPGPGDEA